MTDLQSTLDAIDEVAVHRCGHCDAALGPEAPSRLFCSEAHQATYYATRSEALTSYREPLLDWANLGPDFDTCACGRRTSNYNQGLCGLCRLREANNAIAAAATAAPPRRDRCTCGEPISSYEDSSMCRRCVARMGGDLRAAGPNEWRAHFAAPWNPGPSIVRSQYGDHPPQYLQGVRPIRLSVWLTADSDLAEAPSFDSYALESWNEVNRDAIYRVQNLQATRYVVFRPAPGVPGTWLGHYEGRWEEVDSLAREGMLFGGHGVVKPTIRYEAREDGVFAEVWECRPCPGFRATERMGQVVSERELDIAVNLTTGEQSRPLSYDDIVRMRDTLRRIDPRRSR